ncbi:MAG: Ammonia channel precursor [Verrucomicrobiota bacterium]|jgi:Amt family ammonium transporter
MLGLPKSWHEKCLIKSKMLISAVTTPTAGDNAWVLVSAALVLMMCIPGLFLFYGGLVRSKNVLSIAAQCLALTAMGILMWWAFGYSLVFGQSFAGSPLGHLFGGAEHLGLRGVGAASSTYEPRISAGTFALFQAMFAAITPALIIGAVAERMKFSAVMLFSFLWTIGVYYPVAHAVWGATGDFAGLANGDAAFKAADFAGGIVVHMTSGWSALLLCILVGPRAGFGKRPMPPHSMVLCVIGTGLLWAGWYGFNAGSALAADGVAIQAFLTTTLGAATATLAWAFVEKLHRGKVSVLGLCSGAIAGLATVTNAAGFVTGGSAVLIGLLAGTISYWACSWLKPKFGYDDALDTFGVHGVGGTIGALATAVLMSGACNEAGGKLVDHGLLQGQLLAMLVCIVLSLAVTWILAKLVDRLVGLRPSEEEEAQGLDIADHNEEGYNHG